MRAEGVGKGAAGDVARQRAMREEARSLRREWFRDTRNDENVALPRERTLRQSWKRKTMTGMVMTQSRVETTLMRLAYSPLCP